MWWLGASDSVGTWLRPPLKCRFRANYLSDIADSRDRRYPTAARAENLARAAIRMVVLAHATIEQVLDAEVLSLSEDYQRQVAGVGVDISEAENLVGSINMASGGPASRC